MKELLQEILSKLNKIEERLDEQDEKLGAYLAAKALENMGAQNDDPDRFAIELEDIFKQQRSIQQAVEQLPATTITVSASDTLDCGDMYYGSSQELKSE